MLRRRTTDATTTARPPIDDEPAAKSKTKSQVRFAPTATGETGIVRVATAQGAPPRTLRLSFGLDFFDTSGVFVEGDELSRVGGMLAISGSPIEHIELWLATRAQSTGSSLTNPGLLQAQGDLSLGVKGYYALNEIVTAGIDLQLTLLSGIGESSFALDASQFQTRALITADLAESEANLPVRLHLNFGVIIDGSEKLAAVSLSNPERFALGISDYNRLTTGFAIEVPVKYVTPYLEYSMEVPLGYLATPGIILSSADNSRTAGLRAAQVADPSENADPARPSIQRAIPQRLTPGIRVTALKDLTFDFAVEIGLTPEVATGVVATPPYNIIMLASYALDPFAEKGGSAGPSGPPVTVPILVPEVKEVVAASRNGFVMGRVTKPDGTAADGAIVSFDRSPPVATAKNGRFLSHEIEPGPLVVTIEKDGFKPTKFDVTITAGQTHESNAKMVSAIKRGVVRGGAFDDSGSALPDVAISLTGEDNVKANTDSSGKYDLTVRAGDYTLLAQADGYYQTGAVVNVTDKTETVDLVLRRSPDTAAAEVKDNEIELTDGVPFADGDDALSKDAKAKLDAIVDLMHRRSGIKKLRVESHVDNANNESDNERLTSGRAKNIVAYLVSKGVAAERLEAEGAGSKRPRAPNFTSRSRALNRRVEFHIAN